LGLEGEMVRAMRRDEQRLVSGRSLSPTDIAQFIRLDQCQRYLKLRLRERAEGRGFLRDYGVAAESITPLLTRSGIEFEHRVKDAISARHSLIPFGEGTGADGGRGADNIAITTLARTLAPGEVVIAYQPRLEAEIGGWHLRGDVDLLRLERLTSGELTALIADIKSSTASRVEHRLQVAFYHRMLAAALDAAGVEYAGIDLAILYRGPASAVDEETARAQHEAAHATFGVDEGLLERIDDPDTWLGAVDDLVTGPDSVARRVATSDLAALPFSLGLKCDGCLFNEYCMKWSAERDDLSLLPAMSEQDKGALHAAGVATTRMLANLKELRTNGDGQTRLVPAPGKEAEARELAATWPVGPRLDELIHRARRYRSFQGDDLTFEWNIPHRGYGSLPYSAPDHNPNLVRVYLDAQHDYLYDRIYLLGALVVGCENGEPAAARRRSVIALADGPPAAPETEEQLFLDWTERTLRAIVEVAAADEHGDAKAPIHLIFFDRFAQKTLLEGLGRHMGMVMGATPLYDFVTQLAAFDSPIASFLSEEIRTQKNYPMICQSLQTVAAFLGFDWNEPGRYRDLFRDRLFDFWRKLDGPLPDGLARPYYIGRARFGSQIPLEYAYAAWNDLPAPERGDDDFAPFRACTPALLRGFHARRLEAMERIAQDFHGNQQTAKRVFDLPDLAAFDESPRGLAQALDEFVMIERHVALGAWKTARLPAPEERVLSGDTLIVRYREADQSAETVDWMRDIARRQQLWEEYAAAYRAAHPEAERVNLTKEQRAASKWTQDGIELRLRLEMRGVDCGLDEALALSELREGDAVIVSPRETVDSRLPATEQTRFTPTPRQMLYDQRATLGRIERQGSTAFVTLRLRDAHATNAMGFAFNAYYEPFTDNELYTIDESPDDWYGYWCKKVTGWLVEGAPNTLFARLQDLQGASVTWPEAAVAGQARFLAGLDALHAAGALHDFEPGKRDFIGGHGTTPALLVQGPPGTGKSYSTAFALFARLQGAMAAERDYRIVLSCKTHAATDVLLENAVKVQAKLRSLLTKYPDVSRGLIDPRLLDVPLFRYQPKGATPPGVTLLRDKRSREANDPEPVGAITASQWAIVGATPGGVYRLTTDKWSKAPWSHPFIDCLVLDEASQMNIPEAAMAALPLKADGHLVVVGDHRQMPPIIKHDWDGEPRRTFHEYRAFESLFAALLERDPPLIQFAESFRLHAEMAEFLRREVYAQDGIAYHSRKHDVLEAIPHDDPFVAAVLDPAHPLVVVVHDERQSQLRNPFEQALMAPVLKALASRHLYALDALDGFGVVVPHRSQKAAMREALALLPTIGDDRGTMSAAVDTVERFQGGERSAILFSATESDPAYLLVAGAFLLDPRRLTVALSRAKRKLILVASRSVFEIISPDEEIFAHAQLWKNLLRHTCTVECWSGERGGHRVTVWGNGPATTCLQKGD
jgi:hypothetical protein